MVNANDPVESFFLSLELVKNALAPLESGFRKASKDLEHCWPGSKNGVKNLELGGRDVNSKVQLSSVKKKTGQVLVSDERKKGLSIKVPVKTFLGMFSQNHESKVDMSKKGLEADATVKEDGTCVNCVQFAVTWSLLVNGFVQALPSPFKMGKKRVQKKTNEALCTDLCSCVSKPKISFEMKQKDLKGQVVMALANEGFDSKEERNLSLECFMGFVFDQLAQNLQKFELGAQESKTECRDSSPLPLPTNHFVHLKALTSILEGKRADVSGFLGNLKFARVGGVPSSIMGVASAVKEESDDGDNPASREENGGSSPQKLANSLLSIPLSNVERLRSTLSTVSFTELIELVPQLGRSSNDHPDKKKLFSVQDFFRYTESEGISLNLMKIWFD